MSHWFRKTAIQVAIQNGRIDPINADIAAAQLIVDADSTHREANGLPTREEHPYLMDFTYDEENFPNFFSCAFKSAFTGQRLIFEISDWKNEGQALYQFLTYLVQQKGRLIGYNNLGYDYPVLHLIMQCGGVIYNSQLYLKSQQIIEAGKRNDSYSMMIWENQRFIPQIDLYKIYHFDNKAKSTSLKMIEFNMRSDNIQELPFDPLKPVTREQADILLSYNHHDVDETEKLYFRTLPQIAFREELTRKYDRDFMNHNDTKIGKDFFVMELEKAGIPAKKVSTKRNELVLKDVVLPYIQFENPEFNRILEFFKSSTINKKDKNGNIELKGFFKDVSCNVGGFQFDFGAGGLHASLKQCIIRESDTHDLVDVDVASYYPNLAIANDFFPEHLTKLFCKIYLNVYNQRSSFPKGSAENAMLKLALNGVYGDSNNIYSPCFFDPLYTVKITINGQLLLCMLAEQLMKIPDLIMVQCNTDGITFKCPKQYRGHAAKIYKWWEGLTKLQLEEVDYSMMAISHVNAYLAVKKKDRSVKRIGAYGYETALNVPATREMEWHSDQSALIIPMAAEAALVHGVPIPEFIRNHKDPMDFMLRTKVPRSSNLELRTPIYWGDIVACTDRKVVQNITRYYASLTGGKLVKVMPYTPVQLEAYRTGNFYYHVDSGEIDVIAVGKKPKSGKWVFMFVPEDSEQRIPPPREIGITVGQYVTDVSNMKNFKPETIDYEFYIKEARKIVDPLLLNAEV